MQKIALICALMVVAAGVQFASGGEPVAPTGPAKPAVDDNVLVPCLLPARVRKLGGIVYPERRRLVHSTATACELKGGEYTVYDRARPESAIAFFTPLANEGDPAAQTQLGEVYEYLFDPPRYDDAAVWYRKAADQNDPTGMRRLAHLYEFGFGVQKDPLVATNLWRRAIGGTDDLVLASTLQSAQTAADQKIADLTAALRSRTADADALAGALAASRANLANQQKSLAAAEANLAAMQRDLAAARTASGTADPERVRQLEAQLADQQRKLEDQRYRTQTSEIALVSQKAQLEASLKQAALENQRLAQELAKANAVSDSDLKKSEQLLAQRNDEIAALKTQQTQLVQQLDVQRAKLDDASKQLAKAQAGEASSGRDAQSRAAALEAQRLQQSAELAKSEAAAQALKTQLAAAESEAQKLRASLDVAAHERERLEAQVTKTEGELASTRIDLANAKANLDSLRADAVRAKSERDALAAQSGATPALRQEIAARDATIKGLTDQINQTQAQTDKLQAQVDKLQKEREMQVATRGVDRLPDTSRLTLPAGTDIGKSYALVIGNNGYKNLRPLNFAQSDARKVYEELSNHYGFKAKLLLDTTAAEIRKNVAELEGTLKPNDSVIIYFAGHGARDGQISYWLGVDASEDPSTFESYGVSSYTLNNWLDKFVAKHVLVVADSCYSGAGIVSVGGIKLNSSDLQKQLEFALGGPSRTVISSGGVNPVPDGGAGDGSVFTKTFVGLLNENQGILIDAELFAHMKERVQFGTAGATVAVPTPIFGRIEDGGHVRGQFVFLDPHVQS